MVNANERFDKETGGFRGLIGRLEMIWSGVFSTPDQGVLPYWMSSVSHPMVGPTVPDAPCLNPIEI